MKASMFIAGASALLAAASPINKRAMETDWVYEIVTVTVTAGHEPTPEAIDVVAKVNHKPKPKPKPTYVQPVVEAAAEPTTTSTTTSAAEVAITTVWVDAYAVPTTTSSKKKKKKTTTKKTTTTKKAVPTTTSEEPAETTSAAADTDSSSTGSLTLDEAYKTVMLNYHNIHRANHSVDALTWDSTLAQYAENTANTCVFEHDMDQGSGGYGQNLASWGSTGDISDLQNQCGAQSVTNQWYNSEMDNWSYYGQENPPSGMNIDLYGHFTQVVWADTTKVGCATVKCAAGTMYDFEAWYTVCNYNPQGNYGGEYGDNVLQPLGEKMVVV